MTLNENPSPEKKSEKGLTRREWVIFAGQLLISAAVVGALYETLGRADGTKGNADSKK